MSVISSKKDFQCSRTRRNLFFGLCFCSLLPLCTFAQTPAMFDAAKIEAVIQTTMAEQHIPGLAIAIIQNNEVVWSKGYGLANIKTQTPMTADTIQNIASVSKTVTATAVMQLWEQGKLDLDVDINTYLPFSVRNPTYPDVPITARQLLSHRSSIKDSNAYDDSYVCGDPAISLKEWLMEYFTPGGKYYDTKGNFHTWQPGEQGKLPEEPRNYSNVGFGLLGYLVEVLAGQPFAEYCIEHIFAPLSLTETSWYLAGLAEEKLAVPYTYNQDNAEFQEAIRLIQELGFMSREPEATPDGSEFWAYCRYSFPNYPDGTLRTSVNQLARFLLAYMNAGTVGETRLLQSLTVQQVFTPHYPSAPKQGLCWVKTEDDDKNTLWGHGGGDPGVQTAMFFRPDDQLGMVMFLNTDSADTTAIFDAIFAATTK
ncbi:beta-lactamase [Candidatus Vecturithrix granuli]|uniref:Beta-lactamase n=1 Tax=Vecturithrix granuli TaxID=1499967 RepID=A0A081BVY2_VECG1|nr:beta-lactamase [Candidatus Vecturithrix granuli]